MIEVIDLTEKLDIGIGGVIVMIGTTTAIIRAGHVIRTNPSRSVSLKCSENQSKRSNSLRKTRPGDHSSVKTITKTTRINTRMLRTVRDHVTLMST